MLYKHRIFLAITLGSAIGFINLYIHLNFPIPNDFFLPHCGARQIIEGLDPYSCPTHGNASSPFTTIIALMPFAWLPLEGASAIIIGVSSGLLAYTLNRPNEPWRLLVFLSVPFIYSVQVSQWAPLFLAAVYLKWLYPIILVKPHLGLSFFIMNFTYRRFILVALLGIGTLVIWPDWIFRWWQQASGYDGFIPLLSFSGLLLLLAILRWRTLPARWLILVSLTPQRAWYDQLMLWTIPSNRNQMIVLTVCSWIMWLPYIILAPQNLGIYDNLWLTVSLYYPALAIVLLNKEPGKDAKAQKQISAV